MRDNEILSNKVPVSVYVGKEFVGIGECDCCCKKAPIQCYVPLDPHYDSSSRPDKAIYLCNHCAISGKLLSNEQIDILFDQEEYDNLCGYLNAPSEEET